MSRLVPFRKLFYICCVFAASFGFWQTSSAETDRRLRIYLDADRFNNFASARSIEMGVRTALSRTELHPKGINFEILPLDHRGNVKRSLRNLMTFQQDADGLVVFGGMHSPPYLTYRDRINEQGILLLLPWSAAGPITRGDHKPNWIFRASVDDMKAGPFLADNAVVRGECKQPALLLLNSGWGRFNEKTIGDALSKHGIENAPSYYIDAAITAETARITSRDIISYGADCVIFVGVTSGGAEVMTELAKAPQQIRVFSHWGITGGNFLERTTHAVREQLDLRFLQSCLPFESSDNPAVIEATKAARRLFPDEFTSLETIAAPVGFAHGYDLGLLLLAALRSGPTTGDATTLQARVRTALETLDDPVQGLMKTYRTPFSEDGLDAHEALGAEDLCLARYDAGGRIYFDGETSSH